jgi:hypothetical protein
MRWKLVLAATLLCGNAVPANAGLYTDDLSRCLVEKTSKEDRVTLVQWIFAAMSQNAAVATISKATPADVDKSNAAAGALIMRLLTDACVDKSKKAIKYEGQSAIQVSFAVLGQVATTDLIADPNVQKVLAGLGKYMDAKKLDALKDKEP